jgi:hypothetical protein
VLPATQEKLGQLDILVLKEIQELLQIPAQQEIQVKLEQRELKETLG